METTQHTQYLVMDDDAMHGVYLAPTPSSAVSEAHFDLDARGYFDEGDAGALVAIALTDLSDDDLEAVADEFGVSL